MSRQNAQTMINTSDTRGGLKMRTNRTTYRSLAAGLLTAIGLGVAGCTEDFTEINTNPNAPTDVGVQYLLPAGIVDAVSDLLGTGFDRGTASVWVQHYARPQYGGSDRYEITSSSFNGLWSGLYTGALVDFDGLVQKASEVGNANQAAVGRIMRAWMFHNMTDLWGDIPYSQALGGLASGNIQPAYDDASSVYSGLLSELTSASSQIVPTGDLFPDVFRGTVGNPDLIYEGDMEKWRLFANSLRLRMAMRSQSASEASSAIAAGVFQSSSDEASLQWLGAPPNENPMAPAFIARPGDYRISETLVDNLIAYDDPRLPIYADEARVGGGYHGMPVGLDDDHGIEFEVVSRVGDWFLQTTTPTWILSYAEVALLQAEAAVRGFAGGDAQSLYEAGIRASMETYGISSADIDAYLAGPLVAFAADTDSQLEQIGMQMWFALYDQGPEAYANWRRTGIPHLVAGPDNVNLDIIPLRLPYPSSEQSVNSTNLAAANASQGLGSNPWNVPIFWGTSMN
jgi:hypothetical protein